jgi:hypothetical protein
MTGTPLDAIPAHWRPAVVSAMQFPIYRLACEVLAIPQARWPDKLSSLPVSIRDAVKAECRRVYDIRRAGFSAK